MLAVIPLGIGAGICHYVTGFKKNMAFWLLTGYLAEWGIFQLISVPMIIEGVTLTQLCIAYGSCLAVCFVAGIFVFIRGRNQNTVLKSVKEPLGKGEKILWFIVAAGFAIQMFLGVFMAFEDGDDAFYVATSNLSVKWDSMYRLLPYNYGSTSLDFRHCLAPFPIWIAFISKLSGIHPAIVSHTVMPLLMLPLAYCIYGLVGYQLLNRSRKKLPVFLIFAQLLILWGNVSAYTSETFLVSRSRQGKALVCAIAVPAMFLLLYLIADRLLHDKKPEKILWLLLLLTDFTAALGSTMGNFLSSFLMGVFGLCLCFTLKKWKPVLPLLLCMLPGLCYMILYVAVKG